MKQAHDRYTQDAAEIVALNAQLESLIAERTTSFARQTAVLAEQAALLDLTHDSIFVRDANDRITVWNQGAANTYGWSAAQAIGRVTHELLQTQFPAPLQEIRAMLLANDHWEGELVHTRFDGSTLVVASRWGLQRDEKGAPRAILEINNNITERKHTEDALRQSEERLTLLIQGVKDHAIFMLDPAGLVATWNEGAQRIKGYVASEIIGQHFSKFYTPEDLAKDTPANELKVAREKGHSEDEGWRVRKDGSLFWATVAITPLRDKAGVLRGFGKITRDISDRKQSELLLDQIKQKELRFKDEFLSHVSHELRSPLAAIESFSSIIADGLAGETSPQQDEYLEIIRKNSAQLQSMVEDLLEVTRANSGKLRIDLERVSISRAIIDVFHTLQGVATAKGVEFTSNSATGLPQAYADPTRVLQTLIILCDNAIKFTPAGGAVRIETCTLDKDPSFLLIQVSDTGIGMDADSIQRIFEHHYQVSEFGSSGRRGLGLGLHIAKDLVRRQGGEIWVDSELHHGSTFSFTLPVFSVFP